MKKPVAYVPTPEGPVSVHRSPPEWKPIDKAPPGEPVLLNIEGGLIAIGRRIVSWEPDQWIFDHVVLKLRNGQEIPLPYRPVGWMPLPESTPLTEIIGRAIMTACSTGE